MFKVTRRPGLTNVSLSAISTAVLMVDGVGALYQGQSVGFFINFGFNIQSFMALSIAANGWYHCCKEYMGNTIMQIYLLENKNNSDFATEILIIKSNLR